MTAAYTIPTSGVYYVGLCVVGTTMPTLLGVTQLATAASFLFTGPPNPWPNLATTNWAGGSTTPTGVLGTFAGFGTRNYPYFYIA